MLAKSDGGLERVRTFTEVFLGAKEWSGPATKWRIIPWVDDSADRREGSWEARALLTREMGSVLQATAKRFVQRE